MTTTVERLTTPCEGEMVLEERPMGLNVDGADFPVRNVLGAGGGEVLAADQSLPRLLYELAVRLPAQADIQALCVWLYEPGQRAIRLHVLAADLPVRLTAGMDFPVDDSIAGWVWEHEEPLTINTEESTLFPEFARALLDAGVKSFSGVPLTIGARRIGVRDLPLRFRR